MGFGAALVIKTATFAYRTGSLGAYDWSVGTNWTTNKAPATGAHLQINAGAHGAVSLDNIAALRIASLVIGEGAVAGIAGGDALAVTGAITGTGTIDLLGNASTLAVGGTLSAAVAFAAGGIGETLVLTQAKGGSTGAAISGFAHGDRIDLRQFKSVSSAVLKGTTLTVKGVLAATGTTATYKFTHLTTAGNVRGFTFASDGAGGTFLDAACFAAGTRIRTERGEIPVEDLRVGDRAIVRHPAGTERLEIRWIGRLRIDLARHPRPEAAAPIRFRRNAVAPGLPRRDLWLSPEHCVFLDGRLIAARSLVNGMTITQERGRRAVEYFHIETQPHAIVLAEGLAVETYLDTGNRAVFDNAGPALLHPEFQVNAALRCWETDACAPLAATPEAIAPAWHALAARAEALGFSPPVPRTTAEAAPMLRVAGVELAPLAQDADRVVFLLPHGASEVVLASRWSCPTDLTPWCNDHRRLGLAIREVRVTDAAGERTIPIDHPGLTAGWHPVERDAASAWRWSDGAGRIRIDAEGPAVVTILRGGATTYCLAPGAPEDLPATLARAA